MQRYLFLILSLFCIPPLTWADALEQNLARKAFNCPPLSALTQDPQTHSWSAEGGWKTYTSSFALNVQQFLGAQWQGNQVGTLFCLYQSSDKMTFPIKLQYNHLVEVPNGAHWGKDLGGYKNCVAPNPSDCPFVAIGNAKQSETDLNSLHTAPHPDELAF